MSYIDKKTDTTVIRAKLTNKGREYLSKGLLNYRYWSIGDTEIDYGVVYDKTDPTDRSGAMILAPKDLTNGIKYPISSYDGGDPLNIVTGAQSIQKEVYGTASTLGFFNATGTEFTTGFVDNAKTKKYFKGTFRFPAGSLNGTKTITMDALDGTCEVGDIIMLACLNPSQVALSSSVKLPNVAPYLFFKVITKASNILTLDRNTPAISAGSNISYGYVIQKGDAINDYYSTFEPTYWDYDNLSFQINEEDVANKVYVWNFNVFYNDEIIGLDKSIYKANDYFKSNAFGGTMNIDFDYMSKLRVFGVIHYTNNSTTNIYGEAYRRGTLKVTLPTIMYHKTQNTGNASTMGVTLTAFNDGDVNYDNLKDNLGNIIGRVYFKDQIIVITDEELSTAMSYRANRSWTLPQLNISAVPSPSGATSFVTADKELYVTYVLNNATGFKGNLPCQAYSLLSNGTLGQDSAMIFFPNNQLPFLKNTFGVIGGITANSVTLLAQLVEKGRKPNPMLWKAIDITTTFKTGGGNLAPSDIEGKTYTLTGTAYNSAPVFKLDGLMDNLEKLASENMLFGEENVFMGNITVQPMAYVHKASFSFPLLFNQFKTSVNPTYDSDGGRPVYISEVGIYNEAKELVIIGKTSKPLRKGDGDTILLQLDLDF